jgi:hypothetical protein
LRLVLRWLAAALLVVVAFWFAVMGIFFFVAAAARNTGIPVWLLTVFMLLSLGFAFAAGWFARLRLKELGLDRLFRRRSEEGVEVEAPGGSEGPSDESGREPSPPIH